MPSTIPGKWSNEQREEPVNAVLDWFKTINYQRFKPCFEHYSADLKPGFFSSSVSCFSFAFIVLTRFLHL